MMDFISTHAGLIGLLFFFTFFLAVIAFAYRPNSKENFKKYASIPLEEND